MTGASSQAAGCAAALLSAASWALTTIWWRRLGDEMSAGAMNLAKGLIGGLLLAAALAFAGAGPISAREFWLLALSAVLGISLGDSFYFMSLVNLGPRLTALLSTLSPVFTALLAVALLGERPQAAAWAGIVLVVAGVAWALQDGLSGGDAPRQWRRGLAQGGLAVLLSALGTVLTKEGTRTTPALAATLVRVAFGAGALLLWGAWRGRSRAWLSEIAQARRLPRLLAVVTLATFGGFFLTVFALRHAQAWLVGTLLALVPVFVIPMSAAAFGERPRWTAWAGTLLAVGGAALAWLHV